MLSFYVYNFTQTHAQQVIELINTVCSLPNHLRHLKRIRSLKNGSKWKANSDGEVEEERGLQMLVMPTESLSLSDFLSVYPELLTGGMLNENMFEIVDVPARMANTRKEWELQHREWPQTFHHHMHEKRKLQELELMSSIDVYDDEQCKDELRLIDPVLNKLVCSVKMTIEPCHNNDEPNILSTISCESSNILDHPAMRLIKAKAALPPISSDDYLCTGLVAVLPEEPCLMCAMSLTHSRIRAVILMDSRRDQNSKSVNKSNCGPYGAWGLHEMSGLNHHYSVYETQQIDE